MSQKKILVVDDDPDVRLGLQLRLNANHYDVICAGDGVASIAEARKHMPDLMILDLNLPVLSGIEVCREIRSSAPEIRCLILTSYDDNDAIFAAVMAGAAGYLLKEIRGSYLVDAIRQVAAGRLEIGNTGLGLASGV